MGTRLNFSRGLDFVGNIEAGGNPKVHADGGVTIEEVQISTNLLATEFSLIIELDGDKRVHVPATFLDQREAYDGRPDTAGEFVFAFSDAMAKTLVGEIASGMATQAGQRVIIELDINDAISAGDKEATLYIEASGNKPETTRLYVLKENIKITQVGENDYDGFQRPKKGGDGKFVADQKYMRRAFFFGAVDKIRIEQDDKPVLGKRNLPKSVNDSRLLRNGKTVPAGCYVYDPIVKGNVLNDMLDLAVVEIPTRATLTTTDAESVVAIVEYLEDVRNKAAA